VEVVRSLETAGIASYRLSASGFAAERPLVSNESEEGRRLNRRVDAVVLRSRLSQRER
jgi:flagellar motor protein MotB